MIRMSQMFVKMSAVLPLVLVLALAAFLAGCQQPESQSYPGAVEALGSTQQASGVQAVFGPRDAVMYDDGDDDSIAAIDLSNEDAYASSELTAIDAVCYTEAPSVATSAASIDLGRKDAFAPPELTAIEFVQYTETPVQFGLPAAPIQQAAVEPHECLDPELVAAAYRFGNEDGFSFGYNEGWSAARAVRVSSLPLIQAWASSWRRTWLGAMTDARVHLDAARELGRETLQVIDAFHTDGADTFGGLWLCIAGAATLVIIAGLLAGATWLRLVARVTRQPWRDPLTEAALIGEARQATPVFWHGRAFVPTPGGVLVPAGCLNSTATGGYFS